MIPMSRYFKLICQNGTNFQRIANLICAVHYITFLLLTKMKSPGKKHKQGIPRQQETLQHVDVVSEW